MTSLPEIEAELGRGGGGERRLAWLDKIVPREKRVKKGDILATTRPTFYGDSRRPVKGPHLHGDLGIRRQHGAAMGTVERATRGKLLTTLFITQDYGCGELMRAVLSSLSSGAAIYKVLRVNADETGELFEKLVSECLQADVVP